MAKNKKVMSIAIRPELEEELKRYSKWRGISVSTYIGNIIEQVVKINIEEEPMVIGKPVEEEISPVVLKVPVILKFNSEKLKQWLDVQVNGIVKAMQKSQEEVQSTIDAFLESAKTNA